MTIFQSLQEEGMDVASLAHVKRWLNLFCSMYNKMRDKVKFDGLLNLMEVSP
jgi:hypothetical protein